MKLRKISQGGSTGLGIKQTTLKQAAGRTQNRGKSWAKTWS